MQVVQVHEFYQETSVRHGSRFLNNVTTKYQIVLISALVKHAEY